MSQLCTDDISQINMEGVVMPNDSHYFVSKYGYTHEEIYNEVIRIIKIAATENGLLFGTPVRSFFIPYEFGGFPLNVLKLKCLSFWFTHQENADKFIEKLNVSQSDRYGYQDCLIIEKEGLYLKYKNNPFFYCKIFVSRSFPVCDFSINLCSYDGLNYKTHDFYDICETLRVMKLYKLNPKVNKLPQANFKISITDLISQAMLGNFVVNESYQKLNVCDVPHVKDFCQFRDRRISRFSTKLNNMIESWQHKKIRSIEYPVDAIIKHIDSYQLNITDKKKILQHLISQL